MQIQNSINEGRIPILRASGTLIPFYTLNSNGAITASFQQFDLESVIYTTISIDESGSISIQSTDLHDLFMPRADASV